jgi:hypothetical protein
MQRYSDYLKKKYFPIKKQITQHDYEYNKKKTGLTEEEFKESFLKAEDANGYTCYYELAADNPTESEQMLYLLDQLLEQQKITAKKTSTITGIVVFLLICSIISGIIIAIALL